MKGKRDSYNPKTGEDSNLPKTKYYSNQVLN
ncbi:hypothetical protein [Fluoribacter gormanii]|nr:hypothetical protein [Fluoribacter gormanii]